MRIFTPKPAPAPDPVIYAVTELLSCETWKAIDIVTAGRLPSAPLLFDPGGASPAAWEDWTGAQFGFLHAPYVILTRDAARQGVLELVQRDRDFAPHLGPERRLASMAFGRSLLEASFGARHMPEMAKLHRLVSNGEAPGHGVTVLTLRSVLFGISTVNALMACLFCEWVGARCRQAAALQDRERLQGGFASASPWLPGQMAAWLQTAGNSAFQAGSQG